MLEGKIVLDTSIIIDGKGSELVKNGDVAEGYEIIIPIAALDELQAQASRHKEEGFMCLREITKQRNI